MDDVKFRIGFEDSKDAYSQLENLAKAVESTQARIIKGVENIGAMAAKAAQAASSVKDTGAAGGASAGSGGSGSAGPSPGEQAQNWTNVWEEARQQDIINMQKHYESIEGIGKAEVVMINKASKELENRLKGATDALEYLNSEASNIRVQTTVTGQESIDEIFDDIDAMKAKLEQGLNVTKAIKDVNSLEIAMGEAAEEAEQIRRLLDEAGMGHVDMGEKQDSAAKKAKDSADSAAQASRKQAEEQQRHAERMLSTSDRLEESWINSARSISSAIRGVAMLTASQNEDVQAAIEMLLQVQGAIDIAIGSADAIKNVSRSMRDFRQLQMLVSGGAAAGGEAVGAAARRGGGGIAGHVAGGAVGGAIGGGAVGGGGMGAGLGASAVAAGWGTVIAGAIGEAFMTFKLGEAVSNNGFMGGGEAGGIVDTIGGSDWNPYSWMMSADLKFERMTAEATTVRMQLLRTQMEVEREFTNAKRSLMMDQLARERQARSSMDSMDDSFNAVITTSPQAQMERLQMRGQQDANEAAMLRGKIDGGLNFGENNGDESLARQIEEIEYRRLERMREMASLNNQTAETQKQAAEQALNSLAQQLDMRQKERDTIEESLMSAKERFGQMNELDQQLAMQAMQQVNSNGATSLTREQAQILSRIGTDEASGAARRANLAEADRSGFDQMFGGVARQKLQDADKGVAGIRTEIVDKQQFVVKLEADRARINNAIADEFRKNREELIKFIEQRIAAERDVTNLKIGEEASAANARLRSASDAISE